MASNNANQATSLEFSSRCLPGSLAEQQEEMRIAEFQRAKSQREAQLALEKPERDAKRLAAQAAADESNRAGMRQKRATSTAYNNERQ